jgi:hypothetical protein
MVRLKSVEAKALQRLQNQAGVKQPKNKWSSVIGKRVYLYVNQNFQSARSNQHHGDFHRLNSRIPQSLRRSQLTPCPLGLNSASPSSEPLTSLPDMLNSASPSTSTSSISETTYGTCTASAVSASAVTSRHSLLRESRAMEGVTGRGVDLSRRSA